jgi:hypothetical protein
LVLQIRRDDLRFLTNLNIRAHVVSAGRSPRPRETRGPRVLAAHAQPLSTWLRDAGRVGLNSHYVKWLFAPTGHDSSLPYPDAGGNSGQKKLKKTCLRDSVIVNYIAI